jgi:hypothetical protein
MAATFLDPVSIVCSMAWQDLIAAPAAGKVQRWEVQAANVGPAASTVSIRLTNGVKTINRYANHPVTQNDRDDAPEMEPLIILKAGWKVQVMAGAGAAVEVSAVNGIEADVTDFQ